MVDRAVTDVELERLLAEDLPAARVSEIESKATTADRARLDELRAENQAFLAHVDVAAEVRAIGRRMEKLAPEPRKLATWWRWMFAGGALAAAAAALLIIVRRPDQTVEDDIGVKGGDVALIIHTEHRQLASGDTVQPGERIRFEINAGRRGYVAIIGIDGAGAQTVYFPFNGTQPAAIDPSVDRILPGAVKLDATPGDERFFALYSEQPFILDTVLPALRGAKLPAGVASAEVVLHKQTN
ncbi:MAG: DUF4384 domain-containing protein [Deltaproteobacteria bacterium]|nr:DUF4384 domain-containing protein [Deltaproteobacteria bacterium]